MHKFVFALNQSMIISCRLASCYSLQLALEKNIVPAASCFAQTTCPSCWQKPPTAVAAPHTMNTCASNLPRPAGRARACLPDFSNRRQWAAWVNTINGGYDTHTHILLFTPSRIPLNPAPHLHEANYSWRKNGYWRQRYTWGAVMADVAAVAGSSWKENPDCATGLPPPPLLSLSYSWITISSSIINDVKLLVACWMCCMGDL